jgi:hypothetical protein
MSLLCLDSSSFNLLVVKVIIIVYIFFSFSAQDRDLMILVSLG